MPCGSASSSMVSTADSAAPAFSVLSSGLRHIFLPTGDLLEADSRAVYNKCRLDIQTRSLPVQTGLYARCHDSLRRHIAQEALKFIRALCGVHFIFRQQTLLQLLEGLGLVEQSPDRRCNAVEAEACARFRVERDEFITKLGFHEVHRSPVNSQPVPPWSDW